MPHLWHSYTRQPDIQGDDTTILILWISTLTDQLPGKDVLIEVVLDLLVSDVDAQLLKRVGLEVLKPKDVQEAGGVALVTEMWE